MNKLVNRRFMDFEMTAQNFHSGPPEDFNSVIPRRAGIQIDMDVSERILANLDAGYHAGMTSGGFSSFVSEHDLTQHVA
ncbi:MAG TPA: hypothetical protein VIE89_29875 [Candidatus Binatia bacterium]